jgi:hypothetical protein
VWVPGSTETPCGLSPTETVAVTVRVNPSITTNWSSRPVHVRKEVRAPAKHVQHVLAACPLFRVDRAHRLLELGEDLSLLFVRQLLGLGNLVHQIWYV